MIVYDESKPKNYNETVLRQAITTLSTFHSCGGFPCCPIKSPRWYLDKRNESSPTQELIQRGLTKDILLKELNNINIKSKEIFESVSCKKIFIIPIIFIICTIIGFLLYPTGLFATIYTLSIVGCIMCPSFGLITLITCCFISIKRKKIYNNQFELVKNYIEIELNEKYQKKYGIKWSITERTRIYINNMHGYSDQEH